MMISQDELPSLRIRLFLCREISPVSWSQLSMNVFKCARNPVDEPVFLVFADFNSDKLLHSCACNLSENVV